MCEIKKKYFIITIDTEGDNLWEWKQGDEIQTKNIEYLPRFQKLCDKYGFKPTWLTNYEMINDDKYVSFIKDAIKNGNAEIGMHLHAWNSPPLYNLPLEQNGAPYLIEYPYNVMEEKIKLLTEKIIEATGVHPISHRSGRWATNKEYFELLKKYGYKVDCSVTPGVNWKNSLGQTAGSTGTDYTSYTNEPFEILPDLWECPVTIKKTHKFFFSKDITIRKLMKMIYRSVTGKNVWLRPQKDNLKEMLYLVESCKERNNEYIMFMLHSSEMMPGCNPTFTNEIEIEKMYSDLEILFKKTKDEGFVGITLSDYYKNVLK